MRVHRFSTFKESAKLQHLNRFSTFKESAKLQHLNTLDMYLNRVSSTNFKQQFEFQSINKYCSTS
jgi:hypothetical protein